ncbi:MAG: hypothetical protein AB7U61_00940 [Methylocystis sp.]
MTTRVTLYAINLPLICTDYAGLHDFLLHSQAVRDAFSLFGTQYLVKSELDARDLAEFLRPFLPGEFLVLAVEPTIHSGVMPPELIDWIKSEPSPPRGPDHVPSPKDVAMLPSLDVLLFHTGSGNHAQTLVSAEPQGSA